MIFKVPVVRYLGLNQRIRQAQSFGCQSSQISGHCVASGKSSAYRLSEKNMIACEHELRAADAQY
jgi:hypothetical protein